MTALLRPLLLALLLATRAAAAPCDILGDCVAAHSMVRALYATYAGPLYQVLRASDNATLDIPLLAPGGPVNASAQDAFCGAPPAPSPSPAPLPPLPPLGATITLRPARLPTHAFRHCDAQGYVTPTAASGEDHLFTLVAALSGAPGAVSFRSVNFPAWYLAPIASAEPGRLGLVQAPPPAAATWALVPAAGGGFELRHSASGLAAGVGTNLTGACSSQYAPPSAGVFLSAGAAAQAWLVTPAPPPPAPPACTVHRIYDQSGLGNHLDTAPAGGAAPHADLPVDAAAFPLRVGGLPAYGAYFTGRMGYRNDKTTGVAKGNDPETIYAVWAGAEYNNGCCADYVSGWGEGARWARATRLRACTSRTHARTHTHMRIRTIPQGNAEQNDHDDGAGTMECVYFGSWDAARSGWCGGSGSGPWIMADLEDGLWGCNATSTINPLLTPMTSDFVVGLVKGGGGGGWQPVGAAAGGCGRGGAGGHVGGPPPAGLLSHEEAGLHPAGHWRGQLGLCSVSVAGGGADRQLQQRRRGGSAAS
jgi:hypothetical protein